MWSEHRVFVHARETSVCRIVSPTQRHSRGGLRRHVGALNQALLLLQLLLTTIRLRHDASSATSSASARASIPGLLNPRPHRHAPATTTMEGQKKTQWGVTSAISEAYPTKEDEKLNGELITTLKRENVFESPEGNAKR